MGKKGYIRIQNKSSHDVTISLEDCSHVKDSGLDNIQGLLAPGAQFPAEGIEKFDTAGRYECLEGEAKRRIQKDGHFELVARVEGSDDKSASVKLWVDHNKWWAECKCGDDDDDDHEHHHEGGIVISTDIDDEDEGEDDGDIQIEVRIYNAVPTARWMEHMSDHIQDKLLCQLAMPGTHDSGTYEWNQELGASPDSDLTMTIQDKLDGGKGLLGKIGSKINDTILKQVFERMCKCQDMTVQQQLQAGVRYLDLRVAFHQETGKYYTCHGVYCIDMEQILTEIDDFLTAHPKEIVLLDFNHFYSMEDANHQGLSDLILSKLGTKLADRPPLNPNSTVADFWEKGAQAVVIYHNTPAHEASNGKLWFKGVIRSPWPNKNETKELHDKLKEKVAERNMEKFFVLQGILTPDGELLKDEILESKGSTSIKSIASRVSGKVVGWVEDEWTEQVHNVVIVDFFQDCSMVAAVVNLNRKTE